MAKSINVKENVGATVELSVDEINSIIEALNILVVTRAKTCDEKNQEKFLEFKRDEKLLEDFHEIISFVYPS